MLRISYRRDDFQSSPCRRDAPTDAFIPRRQSSVGDRVSNHCERKNRSHRFGGLSWRSSSKSWTVMKTVSCPAKKQRLLPNRKRTKTPQPSIAAKELLGVANLWDADTEPRDDQLSLDEICRLLSRKGEGPFQTKASKLTAALLSPQLTQNQQFRRATVGLVG